MDYLDEQRLVIDEIDSQLVELFEKRMNVSEKIALFKYQNSIPVVDSKREQEVINRNILKLKDKSFEDEAQEFFKSLIEISRKHQYKSILSLDKHSRKLHN